jgi:hypothetical protein
MPSYDRRGLLAKKRISVDAVVSFKHLGKTVTVRLDRTKWNGPKDPMSYVWKDDGGKIYQTEGLPSDLKVLSDVPARHRK